jgi:thiosulfate/3-mercaptopyruvate sulfurtransferase
MTRDHTRSNRVPTGPTMRAEVLVTPDWLTAHLGDPDVRVVEVDVSAAAYNDGHIDGAVLWNIYQDLKDPDYRLANAAALQGLMERCGIRPESTVVFYGYAPAMGFWLMRLFGHLDARVLDCSRETWRAGGRPWNAATATPARTEYRLNTADQSMRSDQAGVRNAIDRSDVCLIDVRSTAEYLGERFWPSGALEANGRAGHVPTAVHQPIDGLYDERGAFRSDSELRQRFSCIDFGGEHELITYCAIGGRAATAWFVLTHLLGRDHVRVYDGSWADWGRTADTPVQTSPSPTPSGPRARAGSI